LNLFNIRNDFSHVHEIWPTMDCVTQTLELGRLEEQLLVVRAQQRGQDALGQLIVLYDKRLLYYIRRLVGETERAYDVSQEVWLTVHKRIASLRSPAAFRVWLFRIAHDKAISTIRRDQRRVEAQVEFDLGPEATEEWDELSLLENSRLVHQALAQISLPHCEILTLRFLEDLKLNEIAEVIGCGIPTVKTRLHYAKRAIRRKIEQLTHQSKAL
jgi:RNA polymerase sigma-70 factor, ECF subfamily